MSNPFGTDLLSTDRPRLNTPSFDSPAFHAAAIIPSDTVALTTVARAIYVGVTGNITLLTPNDETVLFSNVPVGILPVMAKRVNSTATTATSLVALW